MIFKSQMVLFALAEPQLNRSIASRSRLPGMIINGIGSAPASVPAKWLISGPGAPLAVVRS